MTLSFSAVSDICCGSQIHKSCESESMKVIGLTPNIYQYSNLRFRLKSEIWAFGDVTTDKSQIVIISR